MRAEDFLHLASALAAEDSEAAWRTSVSRSYYGAFHVARKMLRTMGFSVPWGPQAHLFVSTRLDGAGQIDVRETAERLRIMRRYRNWADYDLDRTISHSIVLAQYNRGESIVSVLAAAQDEPFRSRIIEAIRRYEDEDLQDTTWQPGEA